MLKVLGLLGSARKGGNTELLLQGLITGIERTKPTGSVVEVVRLSDLKIKPCLNCGGCDKTGVCIQQDDMGLLFDKLVTYDLILLASPIYFMGLSAWTKAMIDRCQCLWVRKYKLDAPPDIPRERRKGLFISVSGMKKPTVFQGAKLTVKSFFASIHVTYIGDLLFSEIDAKGDITAHPSALKIAEELGQTVVSEFDNTDYRFNMDNE
jgi:multimeric flavodoxin WrbA